MDGDSLNESLDDGLYIPLQRVTNIASKLSITKTTIDELDDDIDSPSCESDTDSDSDNQFKAKKPKVKKTLKPLAGGDSKQKSYDVWAHVQEDVLTESLGGCGVSQDLFDNSRNVESYDYRQAYSSSNNLIDHHQNHSQRFRRFSTESTDGNSARKVSSDDSADSTFSRQRSFSDCKRYEKSFKKQVNKRKFRDRNNISLRLGRTNSYDGNTSHNRFDRLSLLDLTVTAEDMEDDVANDIANKLYEPKDSLILRAVKAVGKDKCVELYYETQRIEKDGGMAVMGGRRRRTPGGVFIFLLKHDDGISKDQLKEVFLEDRKIVNKKKKNSNQKKCKEEYKEYQYMQEDKDLPRLLSRSQATILSVSGSTKSDFETNEETVVTNPPPSPVTDGGRENSSDMEVFQPTNTPLSNNAFDSTVDKVSNADPSSLADLNYGDAMDIF